MIFEAKDVVIWFKKMNIKTNEHIDFLTRLDEQIGDGDHGDNMARGFKAVTNHLQTNFTAESHTVGSVMRQSAVTLMSTAGGAATVLYATAFLRMASVFQRERNICPELFKQALQKAIEGMQERGNVSLGEKTLVDVWSAVTNLFMEHNEFPNPKQINEVALQAMEKTKEMKAKKGKAHYYEESSVGHIDPGAASSYYLFASLAETLEEKMNE